MNKRQCVILAIGIAVAALVSALGIIRPHSPIALPEVEVAPGLYARTYVTDVIVRPGVLVAMPVVCLVTGLALYASRTRPRP